ncbi:hypothetical protein V5O48_005545 [Marasmius crinis-equi]|uniref:F-box domain-containing protein n=1 Tax=Marasmius crinis-equi TaxID=585013 RepID=A0ABR3FM33_9AGAR
MKPQNLLETLRSPHASFFTSQETSKWVQRAQSGIHDYEKQIQQLRTKQAILKRDMACYSSLSSPIRKLPSEILRRIFGFASGQNSFGYPLGWRSPAFTLSSVCSRWREIALGSSEIWSNIGVSFEDRAMYPLKLALGRSRNHPLTLHVDGGSYTYGYNDEDDAKLEAYFRVLTDHCTRWRELDFSEALYTLGAMTGGHETPLLESVTCGGPNLYGLFTRELSRTPNLTDVSYYFPDVRYVDLERLYAAFPWQTMRHLTMEYDKQDTLDGILELLQKGTDLQSLVYNGTTSSLDADGRYVAYQTTKSGRTKEEECIVSRISSLTIDMQGPEGFYQIVQDLLNSLVLPFLTCLDMQCLCFTYGDHFQTSWPRQALSECLEHSGCNLTTLRLSGIPLSDSDVGSLLQHSPSIHTFALREFLAEEESPKEKPHRTVTKSLLKRLCGRMVSDDVFSVQHPLLTKLTFLRLEVKSSFDADKEFVDLIKSRWTKPDGDDSSCTIKRLRTVEFHVERKLSAIIYEPLKWIDSDGMMISVFGDSERVV